MSTTTILPFIACIEVFDDGQWVREAQGSSVDWLAEAYDEAVEVYDRVRLVALPSGGELPLTEIGR